MLRRWLVPPVLLAALAAGSAGAQVTTTGNIRVFVTDQDSLAVAGATVTAASPVVDVTSAVVAEDITLDLTEAVPTGRTYQSYLQLVPGVFPDDPESPGNPDGLVAENRNAADLEFSRFDAAVSSAACSQRGRTAGTTGRCPTSRSCPVRATALSSATPTCGHSRTSSSAGSGSTTWISATPWATRAPRSCRWGATPSTAVSSSCGTRTSVGAGRVVPETSGRRGTRWLP